MSLQITGVINKILPIQKGVSGAGKEWQKLSFIVQTSDQYNNIYCFEVFGAEKVEDFTQRYSVNMEVEVQFNVSVNEWKEKYFTSLSAWKIDATGNNQAPTMQQASDMMEGAGFEKEQPAGDKNGLPF